MLYLCGLLVAVWHCTTVIVTWPQKGLLPSMGTLSTGGRSRAWKDDVILQLTSDFRIAIVLRPCRMFYCFLGSGRLSQSCLFSCSLLFVFLWHLGAREWPQDNPAGRRVTTLQADPLTCARPRLGARPKNKEMQRRKLSEENLFPSKVRRLR